MPESNRLFDGTTAVVTGATGGIGGAVALAFSDYGARVVLLSRRERQLEELARGISHRGGTAMPIRCDIANEEEVRGAIQQVHAQLGHIDILVNAAGIAIPEFAAKAHLQDLRRMMDVNYFGTVHAVRAVLPGMLRAGVGGIVNIGSIAGRRGDATLSGYCASKFAVVGYTEALRIELFGSGVDVSLVMPGPVDTAMLDNPHWRSRDKILKNVTIPVDWVVLAVIAAVTYGLAEVDVPLGTGTLSKLASLFPDLTNAWYSFGTRVFEIFNETIDTFD